MSTYADPPFVDLVVAAIERAILAALAPVVARLRPLETMTAGLAGVPDQVAALAALAPVPGPPGPPGPPGADGAGVDVTCDYDGERTVTFAWGRADGRVETKAIVLPVMIHRAVYVPGRVYERGDCVTHDGSTFHCNADTTARPGSGAPAWTLIVKHGKDAR
jgi:hypothetical protein